MKGMSPPFFYLSFHLFLSIFLLYFYLFIFQVSWNLISRSLQTNQDSSTLISYKTSTANTREPPCQSSAASSIYCCFVLFCFISPSPYPSPLTPHPSPLTPHPSPLTPHPSPLTPHLTSPHLPSAPLPSPQLSYLILFYIVFYFFFN